MTSFDNIHLVVEMSVKLTMHCLVPNSKFGFPLSVVAVLDQTFEFCKKHNKNEVLSYMHTVRCTILTVEVLPSPTG